MIYRAPTWLVAAGAVASLAACASLTAAPTLGDAVADWTAQVCALPRAERAEVLAELRAVTKPNALALDCPGAP